MKPKYLYLFIVLLGVGTLLNTLNGSSGEENVDLVLSKNPGTTWEPDKAQKWSRENGWLIGCNFIPSTAINQLEMWQEETFDLPSIERELGLAHQLGFNSLRVYLHHLLWEEDSQGFLRRVEAFLDVAQKYEMGVMFVLLDGVWHPNPKSGPQAAPIPHIHNSGWVQSPGRKVLEDPGQYYKIENYIKGVLGHFKDDPRVLIWDIFNEPDNENEESYGQLESSQKQELAFNLLKLSFQWAREVNPSQPLTAGVWQGDYTDPQNLRPMDEFMLTNSDIISFHQYDNGQAFMDVVKSLQQYNRPLLCTEYMARGNGSTFEEILPILKTNNIGGYSWGLVAGKSQTIYPWDSWQGGYNQEPQVWFHDIFKPNGEPYSQQELELIQSFTK